MAISREARIEAVKRFLAQQKGRFVTVTFLKKDGTTRAMNIQPASVPFHLVPESEQSESAQRGAETRKRLHPNLIPAWDVKNSRTIAESFRKEGKPVDEKIQRTGAMRSFNVDSLIKIRANGREIGFGEFGTVQD